VIIPDIEAWIEERYDTSGHRIFSGETVPLVVVAVGTGQPKVLFIGWPTAGSRKNVVDLKAGADDGLQGQTVPATMPGLL
jgi:hypothetical protein